MLHQQISKIQHLQQQEEFKKDRDSDFTTNRRNASMSLSLDQLKGSLKREYYDYLNTECRMHGLYAFLTTFVASLAKREQKRQK